MAPISSGTGPDQLRGTSGDDVFHASLGNDHIDGLGGFNTVVYSSLRADFSVLRPGTEVLVDDQRHAWVSQGTDMLLDIQELVFADGAVMLDAPPATAPDTLRIEGLVRSAQGSPMPGVTVTVADDAEAADITGASGGFGLDLAPGSFGVVTGARACDSLVDPAIQASDALQILRLAVGLEPGFGQARPADFIAAEANGDGEVTAADALEVLRHAVGLPGAFNPNWVFVDANADLSTVYGLVAYSTGSSFQALQGDMSLAMSGILVGSLSEFA